MSLSIYISSPEAYIITFIQLYLQRGALLLGLGLNDRVSL